LNSGVGSDGVVGVVVVSSTCFHSHLAAMLLHSASSFKSMQVAALLAEVGLCTHWNLGPVVTDF
jgi:hypothetical protein